MAVAFACPECGETIRLPEASGVRRVRCDECLTLVEVPFFPRAPRVRRRRAPGWSYVAIAFGLAIIAIGGTFLLVRARVRDDRARAMRSLIASSEDDERRGDWAGALDRIDAALALARADPTIDPTNRAETLRARRAVAADRLEQALRDQAIARARDELDQARRAIAASPPDAARALDLAEQAFARASPVPDPRADLVADDARTLAADLVAARGVRFEPVHGTFLTGGEAGAAHANRLFPSVAGALRLRGFLPRPEASPLASLWDEHAPYRVSTEVSESYGPGYLAPASPNRTTRLTATLVLRRSGANGPVLWRTRAMGRTREPAPTLNAFASGYIATGTRRDAEVERKLYDDADDDLTDDLGQKLHHLPEWPGDPFNGPVAPDS